MDKEKIFLPHLYEPFRIEIAVNYARHEMRKLLPELRDESLWQNIDRQVGEWYEKLSIRNFWNGIHGISMGFRLKSLIPWITSFHMRWEKKEITIGKLRPKTVVEVTFDQPRRHTQETAPGYPTPYEIDWVGDTIVGMQPVPADSIPLY